MPTNRNASPAATGKALKTHTKYYAGNQDHNLLVKGSQRPANTPRLPAYARRLDPRAEPVLVTAEWAIARNITDRGGLCLVVDFYPAHADLRCLTGREAWVLWLRDEQAARRLAVRVATVASTGWIVKAEGLRHG